MTTEPMPTAEELLPCPFCGGQGLLNEYDGGYWVECEDCESTGKSERDPDPAIAAWNTRLVATRAPAVDRHTLAQIMHDTIENDDDSGGGAYLRAADEILRRLALVSEGGKE